MSFTNALCPSEETAVPHRSMNARLVVMIHVFVDRVGVRASERNMCEAFLLGSGILSVCISLELWGKSVVCVL